MGIDHREWEKEREYLQQVLDLIDYLIAENQKRMREQRHFIMESRARTWQDVTHVNRSLDDVVEMFAAERNIAQETRSYVAIERSLERLEKAKSSPYFARIDFLPKGAQSVQKIYIGYCGIGQPGADELLVYDWRSPIASMFYDFGLGDAYYEGLDGVVEGTILLKRQFKIVDGAIQYMFDSDVKIDDEVLQRVLSRSADDKMKDIVTSIQREQNRVIRDEKSRLLIVQGVAGSGKTSIALHRAAYLMYKHRKELSAQNILIFSPNHVFSDYISAVLPSLGEENVLQMTFYDYVQKIVGERLHVHSLNEQMEAILTQRGTDNHDAALLATRYKSSPEFLTLLRDFVDYFQKDGVSFDDVVFDGKVVISGEALGRLFRDQYAFLPVKKRLQKIWRRVRYLLRPTKRARFEAIREDLAKDPPRVFVSERDLVRESAARLRRETRAALADVKKVLAFDVLALYIDLFQDQAICGRMARGFANPDEFESVQRLTLRQLKTGCALYEDALAILYLKTTLEGVQGLSAIKHLLIDESQDYSLFHYEVLRRLFPNCRVTMLGDLNQSIYPNARIGDYAAVAEIFGVRQPAYVELTKSYRSTKEIVEFTRRILPNGKTIEAIERHGDKPRLVCVGSDQVDPIAQTVRKWREAGVESIAVVCRSAEASLRVYEQLWEKHRELHPMLVTLDDEHLPPGTVVMPSYLAKGLEFDAVLLPDADQYTEDETNLFYTVCTRALHHLQLHFSGQVPLLVRNVDPDLYELVHMD